VSEAVGHGAALATAALWSASYVLFTIAVRRIGAPALNRIRLAIALAFLLATHLIVYGSIVPLHASVERWLWLGLSGVIGFAMSDALLFRALDRLGAHRTSLVMTAVPVMSALLGWAILGEQLSAVRCGAIAVTLAGIAVVLWEPRTPRADGARPGLLLGVGFALGAAVAQAARYILSKKGMAGAFPVLSTNLLQILCASAAAWGWATLRGQLRSTWRRLAAREAAFPTLAGAVAGPYVGVTLSLVALRAAPVGVASTLMALPPVLLLFVERFVFGTPIRLRAVLGTAIALAGVALIFAT